MNSSIFSSERRSSYIRVLFGSALLLVAVAVLFGAWGWQKFDLLRSISPFRYQLTLLEKADRKLTAIAVGDSHAGMGFYSMREDVKSIAFAGESVEGSRQKLRYLIKRIPKPGVVFLQSQPHIFFRHRLGALDFRYRQLTAKQDFHPLVVIYDQFDACCRAHVIQESLRGILGRPTVFAGPDVLENGYLDYEPYLDVKEHDFKDMALREVRSYGPLLFEPQLIASYETLIRDLADQGITVVLLRLPLSPSYRAALPVSVQVAANELFRNFELRFGLRHCGSWDHFDADGSFFNSDHLSKESAKEYWAVIEGCLNDMGRHRHE